jgi:magnesium transporter
VLVETKQASEMARIYTDILTGMMDAFTSVISNNLNRVMKLLTSLTIILGIPTIVFSFWGQNVDVPFGGVAYGYPITIAVAFGVSAILALVFWRKKFF